MKYRWEKKYLYWGITAFLVIVTSILFFLMLNRFDVVAAGFQFIVNLLMPFIIGLVIAYLLNPLVELCETKAITPFGKFLKRKFRREKKNGAETAQSETGRLSKLHRAKPVKEKKPSRAPRAISITIVILFALAVVVGLLLLVIPQLIDSIKGLVGSLPGYLDNLENWVIDLASNNKDLAGFLEQRFDDINKMFTDWATKNLLPQVNSILTGVTSGVIGVIGALMDFFVGLIVAIYVLFSKEKFLAQTKKMTYAILPVKATNFLLRVTRRADQVFGGFIKGKLIDSFCIGCLCFIGMSIFQMPYALLISVIIGVTNIIPFFGPFIGAIPSALLILMIDPLTAIWFVIFIIVLQQFDGNILGPKILGGSTGLSAFWVIFAIMVFGGIFGFVGMIIGVPAFALIYTFIAEFVESRLRKQELPVKTDEYQRIDHINLMEEPVYREDDDIKIADFDKKSAGKEE